MLQIQPYYRPGIRSNYGSNALTISLARDQMVEVGRTCVHRDYRNGIVVLSFWAGVIQYAAHQGYNYLIVCASVSMADGGAKATNVHYALQPRCAVRSRRRAWKCRR